MIGGEVVPRQLSEVARLITSFLRKNECTYLFSFERPCGALIAPALYQEVMVRSRYSIESGKIQVLTIEIEYLYHPYVINYI